MKAIAATTLALALAATGAVAQSGGTAKPRQACRADIARLCPDTTPGEGRIQQCLKGRMAEVSDGCKTAVMAQRTANRARRAAAPAQNPPVAAAVSPPR